MAASPDIHANVESVKKAVKLSQELLGDGEVQRPGPSSPIWPAKSWIETDNPPMATYPAAIKSAARLIDSGKIDNAKAELARENTLVVTSVAFSLPCCGLKPDGKLKSWPRPTSAMPCRTRSSAPCFPVRTEIELAQILGYGEGHGLQAHLRSGEVH